MQSRTKVLPLSLVAIAVLLAPVAGCGGSAYDALLNRQLDRLRASAPFRSLFDPTQIPDTPIKIRVPMAFAKSFTPESAHPDDGGLIKPERVQPPFLTLPGLKLCYEGATNTGEGMLPFYCYLAVVDGGDAAKLAADLQAQLKEKFKDVPEEWESIHARTPEDKALTWRKLRVTGEQAFLANLDGAIKPLNKDGIFELWIYDANGQVVLLGWRTPKEIEGPSPPPPATGGLTLARPATQSKPDFSAMPALTAGTLTIDAPAAEPAG